MNSQIDLRKEHLLPQYEIPYIQLLVPMKKIKKELVSELGSSLDK